MADENKLAHLIHVKVAAQLAELAPRVEAKVIEALTERELNKRSEAAVKGIDQLNRLRTDMYKLKPDQVVYDKEGTKISEGYSKSVIDQREELTKKTNKLTNALNKALDKDDFNDLYGLVN
jgi:hypothetical protein